MLKKIDKWVSYAENAMLVIGMLSTTFILFANVIMRFCFKSGIVWSNEYANYAIIWIVCGGCGACVRSDAHMRITAIPDMIKNEKVKQVLALIVYVICLAFSVVILTSGLPSGRFHDGQQPEIRSNADSAVVDLSVLSGRRRSDDLPFYLKIN